MDAFALIISGGLALLLVAVILLGIFHPARAQTYSTGGPRARSRPRSSSSSTTSTQMIEAQNERRRRTGGPEIDEDEFRAQVAAEEAEHNRRRMCDQPDPGVDDDIKI